MFQVKAGIAATALGCLLTLPAQAADLRPVYKAPAAAPAPVSNWAGCYAGLNAGVAWADSDFRWTGITEGGTAFAAGASTVIPAAANATLKDTGFTGGGQLGCNVQTGAFVWGLEADIQYTDLDKTRTAVSAAGAVIVPGNITESFSTDWLSTVRGRVGWANGAWLFYATGGLAIADVRFTDQICFPTAVIPICNTASARDTRLGWTVGAGVEWMFAPNWTVKAEYLYVDLGETTSSSIGLNAAGAVPFPGATIQHRHDLVENIVRLGINYRFDYGKGPVVAKY